MPTALSARRRARHKAIWRPDLAAFAALFLCLLSFGQLAGTGMSGEEPPVRLPFVSPGCVNLPDKEVITITAGADRRLYFAHSNRAIQLETVRRVAARHGVQLTARHLAELNRQAFLGLDTHQLPAYLAMPTHERRQIQLPGIPNTSSANELAEYITIGRALTIERANAAPYLVLRADSALDAHTVKQVIRTFERQGIHQFYLLNQTY